MASGSGTPPPFSKCKIMSAHMNFVSHILPKNCLLKQVIEGKIEGRGRRGRRHKQLLEYIKEMRRY